MLEKCSMCISSETIDNVKLDFSSDTGYSSGTDTSSENTYISSGENSINVTLYRWQIVENKIFKF